MSLESLHNYFGITVKSRKNDENNNSGKKNPSKKSLKKYARKKTHLIKKNSGFGKLIILEKKPLEKVLKKNIPGKKLT